MTSGKAAWWTIAIVIALSQMIPSLLRFSGHDLTATWLLLEDGIWESLAALCLWAAVLIWLYAWVRYPWPSRLPPFAARRNLWCLVWAALVLLLLLEEINWGQRILGFDTPLWAQQLNQTGQFNFHNVDLERAGLPPALGVLLTTGPIVAGLIYFCLLPLWWTRRPARLEWLRRWGFLVPSARFATALWFCVAVLAVSLLVRRAAGDPTAEQETGEVFELGLQILLLVFAVETLMRARREAGPQGDRPLAALLAAGLIPAALLAAIPLWGTSRATIASQAHTFRGKYFGYEQRLDEAWSELEAAIAADPENADARLYLALLAQATDQHAKAAAPLRWVVDQEPDNVAARHLLATSLIEMRQFDEAAPLLEHVLERESRHLAATLQLSSVYLQQQRFEQATALVDTAIRHAPREPELHAMRAAILEAQGHTGQAVEAFRQALAERPDNAAWQFQAGSLLVAAGDLDAACAHLARSVALEPANARRRYSLAEAELLRGNIDAAVAHFEEVVRQLPAAALPRKRLADALHAAGRTEEANAQHARAVAMDPSLTVPHNGGSDNSAGAECKAPSAGVEDPSS